MAHEVAHRVQDELGILGRANVARANLPEEEANAISVRIELQADVSPASGRVRPKTALARSSPAT